MDPVGPKALGAQGEEAAARFLARRGLTVLDRNWRCQAGELDIVARAADGTVVVAEVKTRAGTGFGPPARAVTHAKYQRLRRLAALWLAEHHERTPDLRIDVVGVQMEPGVPGAVIEHIEGAFW
jgi:putative endonuclease